MVKSNYIMNTNSIENNISGQLTVHPSKRKKSTHTETKDQESVKFLVEGGLPFTQPGRQPPLSLLQDRIITHLPTASSTLASTDDSCSFSSSSSSSSSSSFPSSCYSLVMDDSSSTPFTPTCPASRGRESSEGFETKYTPLRVLSSENSNNGVETRCIDFDLSQKVSDICNGKAPKTQIATQTCCLSH